MDGILIINKDLGYTSRDIVNIVGKEFGTKKVGHTGTLDPMASGVLVLCLGKALKVCELLTNHDKEYIAGITLGIETDTFDMDGKIVSTKVVNIEKDKIYDIVNSFEGTYMQEVPKYSAVKVNGKKLYEYARANIDVKLPVKEVEIKKIKIIDDIVCEDGKINFKIKCTVSKGTYIRSLVRDIGNKLECPAVMSSLIRTKQGEFLIENAYSIQDIKDGNYKLIDIREAFPDIPQITVSDELAFKIKNGVAVEKFFQSDLAFILDKNNNLISLYKNEGNISRAFKMFI